MQEKAISSHIVEPWRWSQVQLLIEFVSAQYFIFSPLFIGDPAETQFCQHFFWKCCPTSMQKEKTFKIPRFEFNSALYEGISVTNCPRLRLQVSGQVGHIATGKKVVHFFSVFERHEPGMRVIELDEEGVGAQHNDVVVVEGSHFGCDSSFI